MIIEGQVKSKKRVADHGEVFTAEREVKAMCDLVADECVKIESRFLEPACGEGNFLAEILSRKLSTARLTPNIQDYERNSIMALSSIYGIDILSDNVKICRARLYELWDSEYTSRFGSDCRDDTRAAARYILSQNIVCGNSLSLMCVDENQQDTGEPIIFPEWTFDGCMILRRDYSLDDMVNAPLLKDTPIREYPAADFRRIADNAAA